MIGCMRRAGRDDRRHRPVDRRRDARALWLAAILMLCPGPAVRAETDPAIAEFLARINQSIQAFATARDGARIQAICTGMIRSNLNLEAMAVAASGGSWSRMTAQQRAQYRSVFELRITRDCASRSRSFTGALRLVGVRRGNDGDRLVATQSSGDARVVVWRIRGSAETKLRAVDILLDGRSMVLSINDEARGVLERTNGNIAALLSAI